MNNFYVYVHCRKRDNVVFYLGKGCGPRAFRKRRHKNWNDGLDGDSFYVKMLAEDLTEEQALQLETRYLQNPDPTWQLVNKRLSDTSTKNISYENVNEYFYYDETSPTKLRWKKFNNSKINKTKRFPGDIAGYLVKDSTGKQYYSVRCGTSLLVHRIIWVLINKTIDPKLVINHKDGDGLNNSIDNLELITQAQNSCRTKKQGNGAGVYEIVVRKHSYFLSHWSENGKRKCKLFPILKLGREEAFRQATEHRQAMLHELNLSVNAGYKLNVLN